MVIKNEHERQLLTEKLQVLWGMEQSIIEALPLMIGRAHDPGLKNILRLHFTETLNQSSVLRGIFKQLEVIPQGQPEEEFFDMLTNAALQISTGYPGHELDFKIIAAAKQIEEYEIDQYRPAIVEADMQGWEGAGRSLLVNLNEEKLALVKLDFLERNIGQLIASDLSDVQHHMRS